MKRVQVAEDGCWLWTAYCMKNGYGLFRMSSHHQRSRLAHRASYVLFNGEIPDGLDVMHSCDNRRCVNPDHLSVGTRQENMRDAVNKNRAARGETHGRGRLSERQAIEILEAAGPHKEIASRFDVSAATVSDIKRGHRWSHLQRQSA